MYMDQSIYNPNIADIIYGSYIRYDRLYEMCSFAFYGKPDFSSVNIYIDCYSILRSLYTRGSNIMIKDSCAIASCLINLAIHIRAFFETRFGITSKVYLIYGGSRPRESFINYPYYNEKNILMEDSNFVLKSLIYDNLNILKVLCPYLYDIFAIIDEENEFSVIASSLIDEQKENQYPNIIYSKEMLSYQLVAFKPRTFMFRPKKKSNQDCSWVVTKSTIYNAYRYGELSIKKQFDTSLDYRMMSIFQSIAGIKTRNIPSTINANSTIKKLEKAVSDNLFSNGYNSNSILYLDPNPLSRLFEDKYMDITNIFAAIDLPFQTSIYNTSIKSRENLSGIINLYNPQEVRNINDKYFREYPLDLNRV